MALSSRAPISQPSPHVGKDRVDSKQETLADLIDNFTNVPQELWDQIHRYVLDDLDITTVPEPYIPSNRGLLDAECEYNEYRADQLYILDPITLTSIKYYESLFATSSDPKWKSPVWEHHVRFVFPSVLAMGDILTTYQANKRLDRIRRVKVFSRGVMAHDTDHSVKVVHLYVDTILNVYPDLKLDHLEYEDEYPLLYNRYGRPPNIEVSRSVVKVISSPGWRWLTILGPQHHFDGQMVDQLVNHFRNVVQTNPTDDYSFDLPDTPTLKNGSHITGLDAEKRPPDAKQICWGYDITYTKVSTPSWLSGASVSPQIVLKRNQYGVRTPYAPYRDRINVMREWVQGDGQFWNRLRRIGVIEDE